MPRETCRFTCSALLALALSAAPEISFDERRVFSVEAPARLRSILSGNWNGDGKTDLASLSDRSAWILTAMEMRIPRRAGASVRRQFRPGDGRRS